MSLALANLLSACCLTVSLIAAVMIVAIILSVRQFREEAHYRDARAVHSGRAIR